MNEATIRLREIARASRYLARKQHQREARRLLILAITAAVAGLGLGIYAGVRIFSG
ncbi:MAG: hypothetical protein WDK95_11880 [Syntrophorhabdaceae bacterium]